MIAGSRSRVGVELGNFLASLRVRFGFHDVEVVEQRLLEFLAADFRQAAHEAMLAVSSVPRFGERCQVRGDGADIDENSLFLRGP